MWRRKNAEGRSLLRGREEEGHGREEGLQDPRIMEIVGENARGQESLIHQDDEEEDEERQEIRPVLKSKSVLASCRQKGEKRARDTLDQGSKELNHCEFSFSPVLCCLMTSRQRLFPDSF